MAVVPLDELNNKKHENDPPKLYFRVEDVPKWPTTILFALQQVLVSTSAAVAMPLVVGEILCVGDDALGRVKLIGTLMFITGISTIIQTTFGVRLPLLQGPAFTFLAPTIAMMNLPENKCIKNVNSTALYGTNSSELHSDQWMSKMQVVQGAQIVAGLVEMFIGFTGIIGFFAKFIGPLTIAPLMLLLEFSLVNVCINYAVQHWMSGVTMLLVIIVSLYLNLVQVPIPTISNRRCTTKKFPLFAVFPYLLAISIVWLVCVILTITNVFDEKTQKTIRTDLRSHIISESPWFRWPYPFQWGLPRFELGLILGMVAACLASLTESIGNYHSCARACQTPSPPLHAVNRGILMEGLCGVFGGMIGGGASATTYSENVGVIGITKVASRRTMQVAGLMFILCGVLTKIGAILATIPDPLVGGILGAACAMVGGVGLSSVHLLDLNLSRNSAILGFSIMLGLLIPEYFKRVPINTGNLTVDQLLDILLSIPMFVGGISGFILDNTIPGATKRQRGLLASSIDESHNDIPEDGTSDTVYSFPSMIMKHIHKCKLCRYMPFLPPFQERHDTVIY